MDSKDIAPSHYGTDGKKILGKKPYRSIYGQATFLFSSLDAKATFDANPATYAPVNGGFDVMAKDQSLKGRLKFAVWFRNRLHLFATAQNVETFTNNPQAHAMLY